MAGEALIVTTDIVCPHCDGPQSFTTSAGVKDYTPVCCSGCRRYLGQWGEILLAGALAPGRMLRPPMAIAS